MANRSENFGLDSRGCGPCEATKKDGVLRCSASVTKKCRSRDVHVTLKIFVD